MVQEQRSVHVNILLEYVVRKETNATCLGTRILEHEWKKNKEAARLTPYSSRSMS
jgi:hypothetical protein